MCFEFRVWHARGAVLGGKCANGHVKFCTRDPARHALIVPDDPGKLNDPLGAYSGSASRVPSNDNETFQGSSPILHHIVLFQAQVQVDFARQVPQLRGAVPFLCHSDHACAAPFLFQRNQRVGNTLVVVATVMCVVCYGVRFAHTW